MRWLRPQNERLSKSTCPSKRHDNSIFLRNKQKIKTMRTILGVKLKVWRQKVLQLFLMFTI